MTFPVHLLTVFKNEFEKKNSSQTEKQTLKMRKSAPHRQAEGVFSDKTFGFSGQLENNRCRTWREHEIMMNCCFIDLVGCFEVKRRGREEAQSVIQVGRAVFMWLARQQHVRARSAVLADGQMACSYSAVTSKNGVSLDSFLKIPCPWLFNASLSCVQFQVTPRYKPSTERSNTDKQDRKQWHFY